MDASPLTTMRDFERFGSLLSSRAYVIFFDHHTYANHLAFLVELAVAVEHRTWHRLAALAFAKSALVDSRTYLEIAPEHDPFVHEVIILHVCFLLAHEGAAIGSSLADLNDLVLRLKTTQHIAEKLWVPPEKNWPTATWNIIENFYDKEAAEMDPIFARYECHDDITGTTPPEIIDEDLEDLVQKFAEMRSDRENPDEMSWVSYATQTDAFRCQPVGMYVVMIQQPH